MADQDKSVLESLNELSGSEGVAGPARVKGRKKRKVKDQKWMSDDSAGNLLAGLLGETEAEAEAERRKREEERARKEEAERLARERQEAARRAEREARIAEERARIEQQAQRRTQMLAAIEHKRKVDSGEHAEEEEQRRQAEEAARLAAEEEARRRKEAELSDAQRLIQQQQQKLEELAIQPMQPEMPPPSRAGLFVGLAAAFFLLAAGGAGLWYFTRPAPEFNDPYALEKDFPSTAAAAVVPESALTDVGLNIVSQAPGQAVATIEASEKAQKPRRSSSSRSRSRGKKKSDFDGLGTDAFNTRSGSIVK